MFHLICCIMLKVAVLLCVVICIFIDFMCQQCTESIQTMLNIICKCVKWRRSEPIDDGPNRYDVYNQHYT